jgi:two-component system chemotaxis response regulator CheB
MKDLFVYPGQIAVSAEPARIRTILGSCVSVVLWDCKKRYGGLCHYLLPHDGQGVGDTPRYASFALPHLLVKMIDLGCDERDLRAKVYGGANVMSHLNRMDGNIGDRNIEAAREFLSRHRIPILEESLGGTKGRRITLDTDTFQVEHRLSKEQDSESISGIQLTKAPEKCRVLIVDDSATVRAIFQKILSQSRAIEVVGTAVDPYDARDKVIKLKPDVLTLDIEMPKMSGVVFLEKIMTHHPLPVIMVSSLGADGAAARKALELGALEFIQKPSQFDPGVLSELAESLIAKILAAASAPTPSKRPAVKRSTQQQTNVPAGLQAIEAIAVVGNVGSPQSLETLLQSLPSDCPPVIVAIPTLSALMGAYVENLRSRCQTCLTIVHQDIPTLASGYVYFVPGHVHAKITRSSAHRTGLLLEGGAPYLGQRPSADRLLESMASHLPHAALAIQLSGFGSDGQHGIQMLHEKHCYVMVQEPEEASFNHTIVSIIEKGFADVVLPVQGMATQLMAIRNQRITRVS